jgi:hypothetical protein
LSSHTDVVVVVSAGRWDIQEEEYIIRTT